MQTTTVNFLYPLIHGSYIAPTAIQSQCKRWQNLDPREKYIYKYIHTRVNEHAYMCEQHDTYVNAWLKTESIL